MNTKTKIVLSYIAAIFLACAIPVVAIAPFMRPGDLSASFQMVILGFLTGLYVLPVGVIAGLVQAVFADIRENVMFPIISLAIFSTVFSLARFLIRWPATPGEMDPNQLGAFVLIAGFSITAALYMVPARNLTAPEKYPRCYLSRSSGRR